MSSTAFRSTTALLLIIAVVLLGATAKRATVPGDAFRFCSAWWADLPRSLAGISAAGMAHEALDGRSELVGEGLAMLYAA